MDFRTLILFVTSRCNARCGTCFYWQELNQKGDLSFAEIVRLSETMPAFDELWLSGGEPLMRRRLDEIVLSFYRNNCIRTLNLPTNGLFEKRTIELMEFISAELPELDVNVNVALDGFAETHDRIRGVPGNFDKAVKVIEALYPSRERNPNIHLHVNSVITAQNVEELERVGRWAVENLDLNGQYFQVMRGDPKDPSLGTVQSDRLRAFYRRIKPVHEHYAAKLSRRHDGGFKGWLKKLYYTETILFHYTVQHKNLERSAPWPMACTAGQSILVVDYNGDVRACELRERIHNLRDVDCDFRRLWPSPALAEETRQIVKDQCWCTHVCFIHDSLKSSRRTKYFDIPIASKVV